MEKIVKKCKKTVEENYNEAGIYRWSIDDDKITGYLEGCGFNSGIHAKQ